MFFKAALIGLFLVLFGCTGRPVRPAVVRVAIVSPQNQGGPAEGPALLQSALALPFSGLADAMVMVVPTRRQAADVSPHFLVDPVVDRQGYVLQIFDAPSNRHLAEVVCPLPECARLLGAAIGVTPRPISVPAVVLPGTPSEAAFAALAQANPTSSVVYEQWIGFLLSQGKRDEARQVVAEALRHSWPPLEKAQFQLVLASFGSDYPARVEALAAVARAWPASVPLQLQAAEALNQRRDYKGALPLLQAATRSEPTNLSVLASHAYTQAFAGDPKAALRLLAESTLVRSAVKLNLEGDISFIQGDFAQAEATFLAAAELDAAFELGRLYAKAAESALMQGQVQRADGHMQRFFNIYQKGVPAGIGIVQGLWLWRLGDRTAARRQAEALPSVKPLFDFLTNPTAAAPPPGAALQALAQGRAPEAAAALSVFIQNQPLPIGLRWDPVLGVAWAAAGQPARACPLLSHWGLPPSPDDWSAATVWPRQLLVRADCLAGSEPQRAAALRQLAAQLAPR